MMVSRNHLPENNGFGLVFSEKVEESIKLEFWRFDEMEIRDSGI